MNLVLPERYQERIRRLAEIGQRNQAGDVFQPRVAAHVVAEGDHAEAEIVPDRGVLDAVRYHSVGLAEWDMVGRALYCADFLEPGRDFDNERRAELARRFPQDVGGVLREVAQSRLAYALRCGWVIPEPTYRFWNSLVVNRPTS